MTEQDERRVGDRNALCGLIDAAYEFADPSYQQRIWVEGRGRNALAIQKRSLGFSTIVESGSLRMVRLRSSVLRRAWFKD